MITLLLTTVLTLTVHAEEDARTKLVREAQRVEKAVIKDLGSLREKTCKAVKGTECVPGSKPESEKNEEKATN